MPTADDAVVLMPPVCPRERSRFERDLTSGTHEARVLTSPGS
jgi:hypothetical protein